MTTIVGGGRGTVARMGMEARIEIVRCLAIFYRDNGYPPPTRLVQERLGYEDHSAVYRHLRILDAQGIVTKPRHASGYLLTGDLPSAKYYDEDLLAGDLPQLIFAGTRR